MGPTDAATAFVVNAGILASSGAAPLGDATSVTLSGGTFSFADGHCEYWKWKDPRTLTHSWGNLLGNPYQPGNPDLHRVQRALWGELGYSPE